MQRCSEVAAAYSRAIGLCEDSAAGVSEATDAKIAVMSQAGAYGTVFAYSRKASVLSTRWADPGRCNLLSSYFLEARPAQPNGDRPAAHAFEPLNRFFRRHRPSQPVRESIQNEPRVVLQEIRPSTIRIIRHLRESSDQVTDVALLSGQRNRSTVSRRVFRG